MLNLTTQETLAVIFIFVLLLSIFGAIFRHAIKIIISFGLIAIVFFISTCWLPSKLSGLINGDIDTNAISQEITEQYNQTGLPNVLNDFKEEYNNDKIDWSVQGWQNTYDALYHKIVENPSSILNGKK